MTEPIRIVVADDHPVVRDGLVAVLGTQPDFEVVAEAADGQTAVFLALTHRPDVMLVDLEMPELDGVEVIRQVVAKVLGARIIVFTAFDRDEQIVGALRAGAQGYLLKGAPRDDVFRAVRAVHRGGSMIEPMVASKLVRQVRDDPTALTRREAEVIKLVAEGRSNREIARTLFVSERTVKFHVSSVLAKLGATNRTEAVALSRQRGILG